MSHFNQTHGDTVGRKKTVEFNSWDNMIQRCTNPNKNKFRQYGGRGITICPRWLSYANFLFDMGRKPSKTHSLDRIDVNGNYEPSNCRWATSKQQANNRTNNVRRIQ